MKKLLRWLRSELNQCPVEREPDGYAQGYVDALRSVEEWIKDWLWERGEDGEA